MRGLYIWVCMILASTRKVAAPAEIADSGKGPRTLDRQNQWPIPYDLLNVFKHAHLIASQKGSGRWRHECSLLASVCFNVNEHLGFRKTLSKPTGLHKIDYKSRVFNCFAVFSSCWFSLRAAHYTWMLSVDVVTEVHLHAWQLTLQGLAYMQE